MNRFDTMIEGLREEMEVPEKVWEKYMDTLENLPVRRPAGARRCLKSGGGCPNPCDRKNF